MGGETILFWEIGDVCMLDMGNVRGLEQSNVHFEDVGVRRAARSEVVAWWLMRLVRLKAVARR
jgi:hypothetical protein